MSYVEGHLRFAFKLSEILSQHQGQVRVAHWLRFLKCQDAHVAGKAVTSSRDAWIWPIPDLQAARGLCCQWHLYPTVPRPHSFGSLENLYFLNKQWKRMEDFKSLCCLCFDKSNCRPEKCPVQFPTQEKFQMCFPTKLLVLNKRKRNCFNSYCHPKS